MIIFGMFLFGVLKKVVYIAVKDEFAQLIVSSVLLFSVNTFFHFFTPVGNLFERYSILFDSRSAIIFLTWLWKFIGAYSFLAITYIPLILSCIRNKYSN